MPTPAVVLGEESRAGMLRGFESMARILALTLGPIGGEVANARDANRAPEILRDAATIVRRIIQLPDRVEDAGAMLMRHVVWRVREEVGDGSATTAVLALSIAREVQRMVAAGCNPAILRHGIAKATVAAVQALDEMSIPLEGEERIAAVATAATGAREVGALLGEMYDVLGPNANIVTQRYTATYHDRAYQEGARFKGNYLSPYLLTDQIRRRAVLDDVYVLAADVPLDSVGSVQRVLESALKVGAENLLIVCKRVSEKVIGVLTANNERGKIRSCAAKSLSLGDARRETMRNLALLVGAEFIEDVDGTELSRVPPEAFGHADRAIVTSDYFTIVGGDGDRRAIRERAKLLRKRLRQNWDPDERKDLRTLLSHFSAGIGELRLGALTSKEHERLEEIAEQAIKAISAAMEGGIVPGGGAAYLAAIPAVEALDLEGDEAFGAQILIRALEEPMRRIAANAGAHPPSVVSEARAAGPEYGFDVYSKKTVNMMETGIVDPTMVVKRALQLASSGAGMLLTTEALVLHRKPKETFQP